jgi:hypothetical protein
MEVWNNAIDCYMDSYIKFNILGIWDVLNYNIVHNE